MSTRTTRRWSALAVCAVAFALPAAAWAEDLKYLATLHPTSGDPAASGQAEWRLDPSTGQIRLKVEVQNVASTNLAMAFVNQRFVGFILISDGSGELDLDTFQGDAIPRVKSGSPALIRRASDGGVILMGAFVKE
jgi:hypothetical protein